MYNKKLNLVLLGLALVAPFVLYPVFLMKVLCFALFACAFNLLLGFAGMLSFGHAVFLGTGAYVTGYVMTTYGLTPELGILAGVVMSALVGLVYGKLAVRREGIYFAMVTLALAQLASLTDVHWFMSGEVVLMTLLGGMGTIWGPVLGAAAIVSMQNFLASGPLANYIHVLMGVVFVICVLAFRNGLVGELQKVIRKNSG